MQRTRIDRYKIKKAMAGRFNTFGELAAAAQISTTTMTKATDSYEWRSSTLDAIANALGCNPLDIQTVDEVADESSNQAPITPSVVTTARQKQRSALKPPADAQMPPIDPTLTTAEAARREELLRQAEMAMGKTRQ